MKCEKSFTVKPMKSLAFGCSAWLECRRGPEGDGHEAHDGGGRSSPAAAIAAPALCPPGWRFVVQFTLLTIAGFVSGFLLAECGWFIGDVLDRLASTYIFTLGMMLISFALGTVVLAALQRSVLRRHFAWERWWIGANLMMFSILLATVFASSLLASGRYIGPLGPEDVFPPLLTCEFLLGTVIYLASKAVLFLKLTGLRPDGPTISEVTGAESR